MDDNPNQHFEGIVRNALQLSDSPSSIGDIDEPTPDSGETDSADSTSYKIQPNGGLWGSASLNGDIDSDEIPELLSYSDSDEVSSSDDYEPPDITESSATAAVHVTDGHGDPDDGSVSYEIMLPVVGNADDALAVTTTNGIFPDYWPENLGQQGVQEVWEFPEGQGGSEIDWGQARYVTFGELASK